MDKMLLEHRDAIKVMCHSWVVRPIVENGAAKGVVYESKEGRKAILAKVVIDATGDGDLYSRAGAPYASMSDGVTRANTTALVWRIGGVDGDAYYEWKQAHPNEMNALRAGLQKTAGFRCVPIASNQSDMFWMNNWHMNRDCSVVKDQTETEMNTRATMRETLAYLKEAVPVAFRNAFLYDIAPQLGTRISRRLKGEYVMTTADFAYALQHEDVIAWHSTICQVNDCGPVEIPYRAILPQGVENMICPGRHLSADGVAIDWLDLIPQCVGTGQAAGVAAAVAVADGATAHGVDIKKVQDILVDQDVPLPRNAKFEAKDPTYKECVEAHQYGLYTDKAKLAKEQREKGQPLDLEFQEDINKPNVERKLH
ncbi:MAG: FAD-dependent oxidoreductase, partial [Oscillospiraceae bacterium]|nr:FAD-dependent oxidoreductase [Oscillospiraceae bacterium]